MRADANIRPRSFDYLSLGFIVIAGSQRSLTKILIIIILPSRNIVTLAEERSIFIWRVRPSIGGKAGTARYTNLVTHK